MSYSDDDKHRRFDSSDNLPLSIKKDVLLYRSCQLVLREVSKEPGGTLKNKIESDIRNILDCSTSVPAIEQVEKLTLEVSRYKSEISELERKLSKAESDLDSVHESDRLNEGNHWFLWLILTAAVLTTGYILGNKFPVSTYSYRDATIPEEKVVPSLKP